MAFTSTPRGGVCLACGLASRRLDAWGNRYESDLNTTVTLIVAEHPAAGPVRVEVTDTRDDCMPPKSSSLASEPDTESGRGPCLVSALASRWAVVPRMDGGPGKTVRGKSMPERSIELSRKPQAGPPWGSGAVGSSM